MWSVSRVSFILWSQVHLDFKIINKFLFEQSNYLKIFIIRGQMQYVGLIRLNMYTPISQSVLINFSSKCLENDIDALAMNKICSPVSVARVCECLHRNKFVYKHLPTIFQTRILCAFFICFSSEQIFHMASRRLILKPTQRKSFHNMDRIALHFVCLEKYALLLHTHRRIIWLRRDFISVAENASSSWCRRGFNKL